MFDAIRRASSLVTSLATMVGTALPGILFSNSDDRWQFGVAEMSQFYAEAEDEERCLQSSISRRPIMIMGLTTEGKMDPFGGVVQSVENGHREYPGYPVRITMK